jgi:hypothetical protein
VVECEAFIAERLGVIARQDEKTIEVLESKLVRCKEVLDSTPPAKRKVDLAGEREVKD